MRRYAELRTIGHVGVAIALVALEIAAGFAGTSPSRPTGPGAEVYRAFSPDLDAVGLSVTPPNATLAANASVELTGSWRGIPDGCAVTPLAWRWAATVGAVGGSFSSNDRPVTNFTAGAEAQGSVEVELRALSIARCGGSETALNRTAWANLSVFAEPWLSAVHVGPDPIGAQGTSNVSGEIALGRPPYSVTVAWGDGSESNFSVAAAGPFSFSHVFPPGNHTPTVEVRDALGREALATSGEPVYSRSGLAVGISASSYAAEVGRAVPLTGEIQDPPAWFNVTTGCPGPASSVAAARLAAEPELYFSCTFTQPGTGSARYAVTPGAAGSATVAAELSLPVAAPLQATIAAPDGSAAVGSLVDAGLTISGGVAPFSLSWNDSSSAVPEALTVYRDGTVLLPVEAGSPGPATLTVHVIDALGVGTTVNASLGTVAPPLSGSAAVASTVTTGGANVTVLGAERGGTAPFLWYVLPALPPPNGTILDGTLASAGGFLWQAVMEAEGTTVAAVGVVDAVGDLWQTSLVLPLVPPLNASATLGSTGGPPDPTLELNLSIAGGLPPFEVRIGGAFGAMENFTANGDGAFDRLLSARIAGPISLAVAVVDRLGATWSENLTATVPSGSGGGSAGSSAPSPPSPRPPRHPARDPTPSAPTSAVGPGPSGGGSASALAEAAAISGLLVGLAGVAAIALRRRRQRPPEPAAAPEPREVVRRILEPADGADRATVELLAEEEGLPMSVVRGTIDRLVADGVVRSESGADGEEVLSWSDVHRP